MYLFLSLYVAGLFLCLYKQNKNSLEILDPALVRQKDLMTSFGVIYENLWILFLTLFRI